tara:strand:- start:228 stop:857 length:630 start_codon:yes stop_codon:yes gene_type:complete
VTNIFITGCGSGLGESLLKESRSKGYEVYPHYRKDGDISSPLFSDQLEQIIKNSNIDVFINNAAVYTGGSLEEIRDEEIQQAIAINITGQILCLKKVYKVFKSNKKGLIININSLAGIYPSKNESIYCATKFALRGFSKSLQIEAIGTGVEIIDIYPGGMQTRMTATRNNYNSLMKVEEIAEQIISLIFNKSYYTNELILRKRNESSSS